MHGRRFGPVSNPAAKMHGLYSIASRASHHTPDTTEGACNHAAPTAPSNGGSNHPTTAGTTTPTTFAGPIISIVAGDSDLLPPRYSGARIIDVDDWHRISVITSP